MESRWEYKTEYIGTSASQDRLNELGGDGWELIAKAEGGQYIFKRPKQVAVKPTHAKAAGRETVRT